MSQTNAGDIRIEPVDVTWSIEQQDCITPVADVSGSLAGTYFLLGDDKYVWFDRGADTDPAPAGRTAIEVTYTEDDSASTLAGLLQAAIDGDPDYESTQTGNNVFVIS